MYNNKGNSLNEEQIVSFLKDAVSRVENASEADIQAFNQIKKLFKKNVSFMRRNYVAALLIKQLASGNGFRSSSRFGHDRPERGERNDRFNRERNNSGKFERGSSNASFNQRNAEYTERASAPAERAERPERAPRVQIDPSMATTIFIGIGRNRRVFPRDLVGLLVSVAGLERERIGDIRVLANYSFIQLFTEDCEKAISSLDGYDYRGRKLSVSYSRQRVEEAGKDAGAEQPSAPAASADATIVNESAAAAAAQNQDVQDERIPANVSNESHGVQQPEAAASAKISEEQSAFAAQQAKSSSGETSTENPFSETTDDGQVKSHFGSGAAY